MNTFQTACIMAAAFQKEIKKCQGSGLLSLAKVDAFWVPFSAVIVLTEIHASMLLTKNA